MSAIKRLLESNEMHMEVIVNNKVYSTNILFFKISYNIMSFQVNNITTVVFFTWKYWLSKSFVLVQLYQVVLIISRTPISLNPTS